MSQQLASTPKQARGSEEVARATGEQDTQPQATGANTDTRLPGNDRDGDDSASNHEDDEGPNLLYELLLKAENDEDAMGKLESDWDQLKNMVNTPCPSHENKTSLHLAAERGFEKVVKKFLDKGANVSVLDEDGWTPLHFACSEGHTKVVEMLLNSGVDPTPTSKGGSSPLDVASSFNRMEIAKALLQKCPNLFKQRPTDIGWTPLHWATLHNNKDMITLFLENGACIDAKDDDGWTPLMAAVKWKHKETMDTLITHIQGLEEPDTSRHLDICDEEQKTPLMVACEDGFEQGVRALCKAGASGNAQDCTGRTALHYAVESYRHVIVEILINHMDPKDLLLADHNGVSAFDDFKFSLPAGEQGPLDTRLLGPLVDRFSKRGVQSEALEWAIRNTVRRKIFQMLVKRLSREDVFGDVNTKNLSALEWAVHSRLPWILELVIDNFPATSDDLQSIKNAEELAGTLLRESKPRKPGAKKPPGNEHSVERGKSKLDLDDRILHVMQNYLSQFSTAETHRQSLFKPPEPRKGVDEVLPKFHATITQFFTRRTGAHQGRIRWIKCSQSVQKAIYGRGPTKIARETMNGWLVHPWAESQGSSTQQDDETRLKWVHLPVTNIVWMEASTSFSELRHAKGASVNIAQDLAKRILKEMKCSPEVTNSLVSFFRSSWVQVPDGTSASRFMRPLYVAKPVDKHGTAGKDTPSSSSDPEKLTHSKESIQESPKPRQPNVSAAYIPYLCFSKNTVVKDTAVEDSAVEDTVVKDTTIKDTAIKDTTIKDSTIEDTTVKDSAVKNSDKFYEKLLEVYGDDALHQSATLDEAYYHFASDLDSKTEQDARNKTQVVTKYLEEEEGNFPKAWTLIRVKQLWIWTLDEWIITATPHPVDRNQEDDLLEDFLNHPSTQEMVREAPSQSTFAAHMATLIANYCVDAYERKRTSRQGDTKQRNDSSSSSIQRVKKERSTRSIRQIFSDSVNNIARKEKKLFEDFDKLYLRKCCKNIPSDDRTRCMKTGKDDQPEKDATDEAKTPTADDANALETFLKNASNLACEIKDIRDEVNILQSIVNFQLTVQKSMAGNPDSDTRLTAHYFSKDIEELETVAKRVQDSVNTTLNLVEAEMANVQSREATRQGRTMMVFTVVTTLFLPLSFLSSLFALDVSSFQQAPSWALIVIFLASLAFFIPAASIAVFSDAFFKQCHKFWDPVQVALLRYWKNYVKSRKTKTNVSAA